MSETTRCANCGAEVPVDKPHRVGECRSPLTLTEFLLARIAEDEVAAMECEEWPDCFACPTHERFDAARVLADCDAKRRIVEYRQQIEDADNLEHPQLGMIATGLGISMRHLATVYADHPDYDESWRP